MRTARPYTCRGVVFSGVWEVLQGRVADLHGDPRPHGSLQLLAFGIGRLHRIKATSPAHSSP